MNEFIEKLIDKIENEAFAVQLEKGIKQPSTLDAMMEKFSVFRIKEIVNQLAEEYKSKVMIDGQYCFQTCVCTEMCGKCNRLCNGDTDYYESFESLKDEYNNGWIPCSSDICPPPDTYCLITDYKGQIRVEKHISGRQWFAGFNYVIAWQPLPEPFKPIAE